MGTFTFNQYRPSGPEEYVNPVQELMKGYQQGANLQYLKPKLQEELKKAQLYNQYYAPDIESQIGLRGAQAGHLGSLTEGQNITNRFLPGRLQNEQIAAEFKAQNPLLSMTGTAGQLGALRYIQSHPELFSNNQGRQQNNMQGLQEGESYIPPVNQRQEQPSYAEMLQQSILKSSLPKEVSMSNSNLAKLQKEYSDVENGINPGTGQPFKSQEQQQKALQYYENALEKATAVNKAPTEHQERMDKAANFDRSPADVKNLMIAQAAGMGIDPTRAVKAFRVQGKDIFDLAKENGFDPENLPDPIYPNSKADISLIKRRQGALKELESINNDVAAWAGPYAQKIKGYSPKQVMDAISGKNPDQQAKFLAARGLAQELNLLRLMVANGKATVHAVKALEETSLTKMKVFEPLVSQEAWTKMQKYMHDSLKNGMEASFEAYNIKGKKNKISQVMESKNNDPLGIRG